MRVALTGTPGTGKTSVASLLEKEGCIVVSLHALAQENNCICGTDKKRDSQLVDIKKLDKYIQKTFKMNELVFFEGHIGHLLSTMEKVIILRCHPKKLKKRLLRKKWSDQKVMENVDAEALDVILCETVENHPAKNIFEIDTTDRTIKEVAFSVREIVNSNFEPTESYTIGRIDWSEEIIKKKGR